MNDTIKQEAAEMAEKVTGKAREITGKADDALGSLQERLAEFRANATIDEYIDRTRECIRRKPFKSVALAFLVGGLFYAMKLRR